MGGANSTYANIEPPCNYEDKFDQNQPSLPQIWAENTIDCPTGGGNILGAGFQQVPCFDNAHRPISSAQSAQCSSDTDWGIAADTKVYFPPNYKYTLYPKKNYGGEKIEVDIGWYGRAGDLLGTMPDIHSMEYKPKSSWSDYKAKCCAGDPTTSLSNCWSYSTAKPENKQSCDVFMSSYCTPDRENQGYCRAYYDQNTNPFNTIQPPQPIPLPDPPRSDISPAPMPATAALMTTTAIPTSQSGNVSGNMTLNSSNNITTGGDNVKESNSSDNMWLILVLVFVLIVILGSIIVLQNRKIILNKN